MIVSKPTLYFIIQSFCFNVILGSQFDTCLTLTDLVDKRWKYEGTTGPSSQKSTQIRTSIGIQNLFSEADGSRYNKGIEGTGQDSFMILSILGMTVLDAATLIERPLKGWLHVVIAFPSNDPKGRTLSTMIVEFQKAINQNTCKKKTGQATIGEFVYDFPGYEKCPDVVKDISNGKAQKPSKFQFLPCQGVPASEALVSNSYAYNYHKEKHFGGGTRLLVHHLFWRYTQDPKCSRLNSKVNLRTFSNYDPHLTAPKTETNWAWVLDIGKELNAPDPMPDGDFSMNCDLLLNNTAGKALFPWVKEATWIPPPYSINYADWDPANCKVSSYVANNDKSLVNKNLKFQGRCRNFPYKSGQDLLIQTGNENNVHNCLFTVSDIGSKNITKLPANATQDQSGNGDVNFVEVEYDKYVAVEVVEKWSAKVCSPCPPYPKTNEDLGPSEEPVPLVKLPPSIRIGRGNETIAGGSRKDWSKPAAAAAGSVWAHRKIHGTIHILAVFFLTPVSIFVSRYYKETWMTTKFIYQPFWLIIHIGFVLASLYLHVIGIHSARLGSSMIGNSRKPIASLHCSLGYATFGLFLFLSLFGSCRPVSKALSICCISLHWLLGMIAYGLNFACVITSIDIPGSPSSSNDPSYTVLSERFPQIFVLTFVWIGIDLIFHIIVTIHMCMMDDKSGVKRIYCPVPIPTIDEDEEEDTPGPQFRKILLVLYLLICGIITAKVFIFVVTESSNGRGFLETTFTHDENGTLYNNIMDSPAVKKSFDRVFPPFF